MYKKLVTAIALIATLIGCTETMKPLPPQSVLFVGNSFTSANGGLAPLIHELAISRDPDSQLLAAAITLDGATLELLWRGSDAHRVIRMGAYEVVVLQGDIPEGSVETFRDYALKFVTAAKKAGVRPVLLMAWEYDRLGWITQDEIAQAHDLIAMDSAVDVAPVGLAWSRVMQERPELNLYAPDREHPSLKGSYLTACVVYATVMRESPEGVTFRPVIEGMRQEEATFLQKIAWSTVQVYENKRKTSRLQ